jgi:hypothetical protein
MDFIGDSAITAHLWHLFQDRFLDLAAINQEGISKVDVLGDMRASWDNFVATGQCWALMIGAFFGYMIKSMTSF